jgi:hypothetical protein
LYRSHNIMLINLGDWARLVARMREGRNALKILTAKLSGKRALRRFRPSEDNMLAMSIEVS